jgi:VanZ family protein
MPTARARMVSLAAVLAFGILIELIQIPLPSRTASLSDLVASTVGGFGGFGLAAAAVSVLEALRGGFSGSLTSAPQRR